MIEENLSKQVERREVTLTYAKGNLRSTESTRSGRFSKGFYRTLVSVGATFASLIAGEYLASRIINYVGPNTKETDIDPRIRTIKSWEKERNTDPNKRNWGVTRTNTYTLYENGPDYVDSNGKKQHDQFGFRRGDKETRLEKGKLEIRGLAIGSSGTYGYGVINNPEYAWPTQLESNIANYLEKIGSDYLSVILNGGVIGADSATLRNIVAEDYIWMNPDFSIIYLGINDTFAVFWPSYDPSYRHWKEPYDFPYPRNWERPIAKNSDLGKLLISKTLTGIKTGFELPYQINPAEALERARETYPLGYERNLETMISLLKSRGSKVILIPEIFRTDENGRLRLTDQREDRGLVGLEEPVTIVLIKHKEIMKMLADKHRAIYLDLNEERYKGEGIFVDFCHKTKIGQKIMADDIWERLSEEGILPSIIKEREAIKQAQQKSLENSLNPDYKTPNKNLTLQQIHDEYQAQQPKIQDFQATPTPQDEIQTDSTISKEQSRAPNSLEAIAQ